MIDCYVAQGSLHHGVGDRDAWLTAAELDRARRFRLPDDRARFVAGRALIRTLVSELLDVTPAEVGVRTICRHCGSIEHGRPVAVHRDLHRPVSISHAGDCVVVATTVAVAIGVDVEVAEPTRVDDLVEHVRSPDDQLGDVTEADAFYRLWTAKEAVLKCTGHGLLADMRLVGIDLREPGPTRSTWRDGRGPPTWTTPLEMPAGYVGALAIAADEAPSVIWSPGGESNS